MTQRPRSASIAIAGLMLAVLVVADVVQSSVTLTGYFGLPGVVIAASGGLVATGAFGVVSIAVAVASGSWDDRFGTSQHLTACLLVAAEAGVAIYVSIARLRRERELSQVRAVADVAQRALLPAVPAVLGEVGFATRYVSAAREALVGGDLYEVVATQRTLRIIIGDVKGKGLPAVRLTTVVLGAFREAAVTWLDVEQVASACGRAVSREAEQEDFVTALMIDIHADGALTVLSAGHPPPMLISASGARALPVGVPSPPLGIAESFRSASATWSPGDRLLLYTDGLVEARDRRGEFFPLEGYLSTVGRGGLDAALDGLIESVHGHVGGEMHDDLALLLAERLAVEAPTPGPSPPAEPPTAPEASPEPESEQRRPSGDAAVRAAPA